MSEDAVHIATLFPQPYTVIRGTDLKPAFRATGAVISARRLVVATVNHRPGGAFYFDAACSFSIDIGGHSQFHVIDFANEVQGWINNFRIDQLAVRMNSPNAKKFVPSAFAFRIETILKMVPAILVETVNTQRVTAWAKGSAAKLPFDALNGLKASDAALWKGAIETACFAIEYADDDRLVPDECFE